MPFMKFIILCDVVTIEYAYMKYVNYMMLIASKFYEVFTKRHDAWFSKENAPF